MMRRAAPPHPSDHATKKARAAAAMQLRRALPHMSVSALAAFVQVARTTDLDELPTDRKAWAKAKMASLADTPYGPMLLRLPLTSLPPHPNRDLVAVNPFAFLYTAFPNWRKVL